MRAVLCQGTVFAMLIDCRYNLYFKNSLTLKLERHYLGCLALHNAHTAILLKGALDNILKFYFWLNFIYHVKCNC